MACYTGNTSFLQLWLVWEAITRQCHTGRVLVLGKWPCYVSTFSPWGRLDRKLVGNWNQDEPIENLYDSILVLTWCNDCYSPQVGTCCVTLWSATCHYVLLPVDPIMLTITAISVTCMKLLPNNRTKYHQQIIASHTWLPWQYVSSTYGSINVKKVKCTLFVSALYYSTPLWPVLLLT